jgi:hypothetical protein
VTGFFMRAASRACSCKHASVKNQAAAKQLRKGLGTPSF